MFSGCHSLCMAPFLHEIISKKAILQPCNWYKISKCCDMRCPRLKTLMQQSDWWEIHVHILVWRSLVKQATYHSIHWLKSFFLIKNNWKMRLRNYFRINLDFELRCSTNWSEGIAMCSVSLWKASFFSQVSSMSKAEEKSLRTVKFQA